MRILILSSALATLLACGPTGPKTANGPTPCQQLRECTCDPERTSDVDFCNQQIDSLEAQTDPDRLCSALLRFDCSGGLQVDTTRISL